MRDLASHRDAWVEVDLQAVVANAHALASLCAPACRLAPVVKANANGHGTVDATQLGDDGIDPEVEFVFVGADGDARTTIEELAVAAEPNPQEILVGFDHRLPAVFRGEPVAGGVGA